MSATDAKRLREVNGARFVRLGILASVAETMTLKKTSAHRAVVVAERGAKNETD